jgi:RNA polymerase subunit RPABC4/transcription elongation factor Spt4
MFLLSVALVFWLFRDARRRGSNGIVWALIGGFALLIGVFIGFSQSSLGFVTVGLGSLGMVLLALMVFTFIRPAEFAADAQERELSQRLLEAELETHACPSCGGGIETDFLICPACNITLRRPCEFCSRPVKVAWATCPYCRARKGQEASAPPKKKSASPKKRTPSSSSGSTRTSSGSTPKRTSSGSSSPKTEKQKPSSSSTFKD